MLTRIPYRNINYIESIFVFKRIFFSIYIVNVISDEIKKITSDQKSNKVFWLLRKFHLYHTFHVSTFILIMRQKIIKISFVIFFEKPIIYNVQFPTKINP